jgi:anaerobic magnesium-protoporphyrin IX monomethyl ester cyclase
MKILFVNPPVPRSYYNREYYLPSSLLYLSAVAERNGDEPYILDFKADNAVGKTPSESFCYQQLSKKIDEFQPDALGLGCFFSGNFPDTLKLAQFSKKHNPNIQIIIGGVHATLYAKAILDQYNCIDYVIRGEGEASFVDFIHALKQGTGFDKIDGFAYRHNGNVVEKPKTTFIKDLDSLPIPAYHLVNFKMYHTDTSLWTNPKHLDFQMSIPIITSRSCPKHCNFCSMHSVMGRTWRPRSPKNVVDELELLYTHYGQRHFSFMDDNFTADKGRLLAICRQIRDRHLDIHFETPNGVYINSLDEEVIEAMAAAGLTRISLPIESGNDHIRNTVMKKHVTKEKIRDVVRLIRQHPHLYIRAFFIIGMPEETKETLEDTYNLIKEINADRAYLQHILPFPGTDIFEQVSRDNLFADMDVEKRYGAQDLDGQYWTNYDRYFVKPYNLEINDLREFRARFDQLVAEQRA